jgi:hypothetical protein
MRLWLFAASGPGAGFGASDASLFVAVCGCWVAPGCPHSAPMFSHTSPPPSPSSTSWMYTFRVVESCALPEPSLHLLQVLAVGEQERPAGLPERGEGDALAVPALLAVRVFAELDGDARVDQRWPEDAAVDLAVAERGPCRRREHGASGSPAPSCASHAAIVGDSRTRAVDISVLSSLRSPL